MSASAAPTGKYAPPVPPVAMEMNFVSAARMPSAQQTTTASAAWFGFIASSSLRADRDHRLAEDGVQIDVAKPGVQQVMGEWGQTDAQVAQLQGTVLDSKRSGIVAEDLAGAESVGDPGAGGREFRRDQDQL